MTTISLNEIRSRAASFALKYKDAQSEHAEAQGFEIDFLHIFGVTQRKVATFEKKVLLLDGSNGYIDLFWKGMIIIEMKSLGKDLEQAYQQAKNYVDALPQHELPKAILICDFKHFCFYNLDTVDADKQPQKTEFLLLDLSQNIELFTFLAGYTKITYKESDPVNIEAAELMGKLHDRLKENGYSGHQLEVYLVRLLFCLFADNTGIFEKDSFVKYIVQRTNTDGSDLALHIHKIFETLNKPQNERSKNLDEQVALFPYINGGLFSERIEVADFDLKMRETLIECAKLDWRNISPAIFGSMFQSVMSETDRRNLGAHYTSETNILKLIHPLFLDNLWAEFNKIAQLKSAVKLEKLKQFHSKIANLKFLDPACGCGNFLVITYRELRELEITVIKEQLVDDTLLDLDVFVKVNVHQFYGIELEEFPSLIAQTALWLTDHQMNIKISNNFGQYFIRIPLTVSPTIICANALQTDWQSLIPKTELHYILGNPPFLGARLMSGEQKKELETIFLGVKNCGNLDYVTCWYKKACEYIQDTKIECAFVSTNSICQGEQIPILWRELTNRYGITINFAHQTFKWTNEARGKAAVYCIIVGFSTIERSEKKLYVYESVTAEPHETNAKQINAYLVNSSEVYIDKRSEPLCNVSPMVFGNMPNDGGYFLLTEEEKNQLIKEDAAASEFIRSFLGSEEFINNKKRYCIWLKDIPPQKYRMCKPIVERITAVQKVREASTRKETKELSKTPMLFGEIRQPETDYILIPRVSSERRKYIPIGFMNKETIASDATLIIPNATLYEFAVLTSTMHMAWMRSVCGRLKSDYRYSKDIVYNNFVWATVTDKQKTAIETAAQAVLDARLQFPNSSLADLYDPVSMPKELLKTHEKLDKLVDKSYGKEFADDTERVSHLFELYKKMTADLFTVGKKKRVRG